MQRVAPTFRAALLAIAAVCVTVPAQGAVISFTTNGPITIPTLGNADPYPVPITVSGVTGTVTDISFTLTDFSHSFPQDVGMILVAPDNMSGIVIFDGGTTTGVSGLTLTFQDGGDEWPLSGSLTSGTYAPSANFSGDSFPDAPSIPGVNPTVAGPQSFATAFGGLSDVNGIWNLYIRDFQGADSGSIRSVSLNFTTAEVPAPPAVFTLLMGLLAYGGWRRSRH